MEDIDKILALGYNGLRKHQKTEDERFLYWCDKKGVLVWSEMGAAYEFDDYAVEEFTREWMEIVRQNYSHPCIITWTPFNESWGISQVKTDPRQQHFTEEIYHLTKALDPYRPVIVNDGWSIPCRILLPFTITKKRGRSFWTVIRTARRDIKRGSLPLQLQIRICPGLRLPGTAGIISEFGGIAFAGEGQGWGYGNKVSDKDAFTAGLIILPQR